jgi:hypothetical protein
MTDAPRRIQRSRARGWKMPENTVYVGRGSRWGNPWIWRPITPGGAWMVWNYARGRREPTGRLRTEQGARIATIGLYAFSVMGKRGGDPVSLDFDPREIARLRGKNLACWCRLDQPCHADVLLELANAPLRCEAVDA